MAKRALLSVSDKTGIVEFARGLHALGWELLSTGGTQKALAEAGIAVTPVEDITKFPECFGGRVKTMHPKITGGILLRRNHPDDAKEAEKNGIEPIDLVAINLYPFEATAKKAGVTHAEIIENIDIGGPTLLRSAAKNADAVTVLCDPADYGTVLSQLQANGATTPALRQELAVKVFLRTAAYDGTIVSVLSQKTHMPLVMTDALPLRYGENPHQQGAYYDVHGMPRSWRVVQEEKQMSYLNLLDADGAWNLVREFSEPTAACIKHANPSGVATHANIIEAFQRSYDTDKLSAFGVIVALNRPCPKAVIAKIIDQKIFTEVIIAPGYEPDAVELLKSKPNIRAIAVDPNGTLPAQNIRTCFNGMLVQTVDDRIVTAADLTCVTDAKPTDEQLQDLLFAWHVVKHAKSNAIVFAKDRITVGIGCGQTSRVDSTHIAARRAGERAQGAVMASDAFFPFPDSIEEAVKHGIAAIIHPGGSIRDAEVIAKANELGIPMVITGIRGFRH